MTAQQAYQVLVQAAQQARLSAQEHNAVAQAAELLGKMLFQPQTAPAQPPVAEVSAPAKKAK